ncbi:oxidoreductase FAD/NAD(P)-binding domain protein [Syntrophobotulus glycolicus DSM 8271]|uniref:Oxidoreductase FAD/NAD(P)-binding domain protein n=1 Tax=Syntrophobotulus glycolicus (strain DSM 8271 / FlGlyR) TaxID=645991 RepID=F0T0Q3_SYNGF|nr:FAD/NAD(P)-binding protein [Syntrophobotulus glycolicus]ADY56192.1 oxidoreductase FAD/NAD(P)-binding domain protein [Syntrophobotulus glycolicus DSM 8271]
MGDCHCSHDHAQENALIPIRAKVINIVQETPDTKTFFISTMDDQKPFDPQPGQLGMLSLPNVGEGMFSITNKGDNHIEMAIKAVGELTNALHEIEVGQEVGIRGPYGNGFPLEHCKGKDLLFIGGGIGLAPVRSLIMHCIRNRADYGKLTVVYGARSKDDLTFKEDLFKNWPKVENMDLFVTIDRAEEGWDGHVGFVPSYVEELAFKPQVTVLCGPPIMIKFTLPTLQKIGFPEHDIITTLEMRMKCGVGKCGRCNIGSKYVCLDGPVFTLAELKDLPPEY